MLLSDAELVTAAQNGDVASFDMLLERHRAPLYVLALGMSGYKESLRRGGGVVG